MRIPLTKGQTISLWRDSAQHTFQIDSVIGDGASCIAYSAHKVGAPGKSLNYRIKECYPYRAHISRNGQQLAWEQEEEKTAAFEKMRRVHDLIVDLRNNENVGNNITSAELYEGNDTLYSVMEVNYAQTYDKDASRDLHSILETLRVLTEVVGNLHDQGFLHLDIKPENFLVTQKPSTNIWLFDVDSITARYDIDSGRIHSIPYSGRWAAPEQRCNKPKKLCPATDLFAIGAILFEKVMGREVSNNDCGLFADWDFDGDIFEEVNPKIKRYFRNIFKKTLSVNVSRRFQSASELAAALEEARDVAAEKLFLISDCPPVTTSFVGRGREMKAIAEAFQKSHVVFLHGEGGIGKSTLALAYANHEAKQYDAILFLRYRGSLEEALSEIEIQNYDEDKETKRRRTLKGLLDKHILLIIDNFDVALDEDPFLSNLLRYRANILFTSRTDFSGVLSGDVIQVEVGKLSQNNLLQVFCTAAGQVFHDEDCTKIENLFSIIDYHTYAAEVLGRKLEASGWSIDYLTQRLTDGLLSLDDGAKIRVSKEVATGKHFSRHSVPEIFRALFRISELNETQKRVLRNMYLLRFLNVDKNTFRNFVSYAMMKNEFDIVQDAFNELVELNWIQREREYFIIHPIVAELVHQDLQPSETNCPGFFDQIQFHIGYYLEYDGTMGEHQFSRDANLLCSFLLSVNLEEEPYLQIAVDWLKDFTKTRIENDYHVGNLSNERFLRLYHKLAELTQNTNLQLNCRHSISVSLLKIVTLDYFSFYYGENAVLREQERRIILENWFANAKRIAESAQAFECESLLDAVYTSFLLTDGEIPHYFPNDFLHKLYSERPQSFDTLEITLMRKERIGIPLTDEEKQIEDKISKMMSCHENEPSDWEKEVSAVNQRFFNSNSMSEVAYELANDDNFEIYQKVALIEHQLSFLVDWISHHARPYNEMEEYVCESKLTDINNTIQILTNLMRSEDFKEGIYYDCYDLYSDEWIFRRTSIGIAFYFELSPDERIKFYNTVLAALSGNYEVFSSNMHHKITFGTLFPISDTEQYIYDGFTRPIITICGNVERLHWILPYLVSAVSNRFPDDNEDSERAVSLIAEIRRFAAIAANEVGEQHPDYQYYLQLKEQFSNRYNRLIGKNWSIKE